MVRLRFGVQLLVGLCRTNYHIDLYGIVISLSIFVPDGECQLMCNCWRTPFMLLIQQNAIFE